MDQVILIVSSGLGAQVAQHCDSYQTSDPESFRVIEVESIPTVEMIEGLMQDNPGATILMERMDDFLRGPDVMLRIDRSGSMPEDMIIAFKREADMIMSMNLEHFVVREELPAKHSGMYRRRERDWERSSGRRHPR